MRLQANCCVTVAPEAKAPITATTSRSSSERLLRVPKYRVLTRDVLVFLKLTARNSHANLS